MSASVRGARSASPRMVVPMPGFRLEYRNMSSAAIAGPTISLSVNAGPSPTWVNRSPHNSVPVVLFVQNARLPAMRDMRRVEVADALAVAEVDRFTVAAARAARGRPCR